MKITDAILVLKAAKLDHGDLELENGEGAPVTFVEVGEPLRELPGSRRKVVRIG